MSVPLLQSPAYIPELLKDVLTAVGLPIFFFAKKTVIVILIIVDFGEMKTVVLECKEKCFKMMLSAYLPYCIRISKCILVVVVVDDYQRKRSAKLQVIHE